MLCPRVDEDDLIVSEVELSEALTHFACIGWKVVFAAIPPAEWGGGWPAFCVALTFIGTITAIVAEVATILGCVIGLKDSVTAITFVAMGTSLPDTFASVTAAQQSEYADSAIGNVTGSNSVNVFVGLGLPWMISSIY
jgi:solute carrier family 8 (sodium/calcium exchanger)